MSNADTVISNGGDDGKFSIAERMAIVAFLRQGGERVRGKWYSWDSEMAGYARSFADRIESGDYQS